jgi:hypothetical protein
MSSPYGKTPESYFSGLRRKDSKNALTTCHGVTSNGRACRRPLSSPKNSSKFDGAVVITGNDKDPAVFFCWQHKDQAESANTEEGSVIELKGRHSLEEAFRSLGLEDVGEDEEPDLPEERVEDVRLPEPTCTVATDYGNPNHQSRTHSPPSRTAFHRPREEGRFDSSPRSKPRKKRTTRKEAPRHQETSFWSLLFSCFTAEESPPRKTRYKDEKAGISRPKPEQANPERPNMRQSSTSYEQTTKRSPKYFPPANAETEDAQLPRIHRRKISGHQRSDSGIVVPRKEVPNLRRGSESDPSRRRPSLQVYRDPVSEMSYQGPYLQPPLAASSPLRVSQQRPVNLRSRSTPDPQQLSRTHGEWPPPLPRNASDTTRIAYAKLLTAMSEPPTKADSPGYIYIFWQTEVEATDDETSAVASIISAPNLDRGLQRQETILQRRFFQTSANARLTRTPSQKRTIFLKIGRATNVHQRLTQWRKQCEYAVSLLRSYPYNPDADEAGIKVPFVGKVERLIHLHLEMQGQRVKKECKCGTEHKEWFEVDATAKGVRDVDEIVRRWVQWSEDRFGL